MRARSLLEHFGEAPKILAASKNELSRVRNIGDETADAISNWEKSIDLAGELKRVSDFGCHVLISSDEHYPALLREIYDPPIVLYVKGELTAKDKNSVAMVGSRELTSTSRNRIASFERLHKITLSLILKAFWHSAADTFADTYSAPNSVVTITGSAMLLGHSLK